MGRLVETERVRDYASIRREDHDQLLDQMIAAAEAFVERRTGRRFSPEPALEGTPPADTAPPVTKQFATRGLESVRIPDLRVATATTLGGVALTAQTGYGLSGRLGEPATLIELSTTVTPSYLLSPGTADLVITGRWGFLETPDDISEAVAMLVARKFKKRDANWADNVQTGPEGAVFSYSRGLPAEIREVLDSYTVMRVAVV